MEYFIYSLSEFIIGFFGWFVYTETGRFILTFWLVVYILIFGYRFIVGRR